MIVEEDGTLFESAPADAAPQKLSDMTSLRPLWQAVATTTLLKLDRVGWCLVAAEPLLVDTDVVGGLVLAVPLSGRYLDSFKDQIRSDFTIHRNGELIAATTHHPDPSLTTQLEGTVTMAGPDQQIAIQSFQPKELQGRGERVVVTAAEDVRELSAGVTRRLKHALAILLAALIVAIALALRTGSRIADVVQRMATAAQALRNGKYQRVAVTKTGDELEKLSDSFNEMVAGLEERDHIRDTFGKYVSRQVADQILKGNVDLRGEIVPVTILFSDIREFTSISEKMEPRALLALLNDYFAGMVDSVLRNHGVVDKFIGDGMMAVFGAPTPDPGDPLRAVRAALEMRAVLIKLNERLRSEGQRELRIGVGIHTGPVVAGNIGHVDRKEYTVIGDSVNLSSRLESMTKELQTDIVLSADTYEAVKDDVLVEPLQSIRVRGREQEVMVYRLIGLSEKSPGASLTN
jgi:adenylate cyclase